MKTKTQLLELVKSLFPDASEKERNMYVQGYIAGYDDSLMMPDDAFFIELANKMRLLWPPGGKNDKWAWRDSVPNLVKRLKFIWADRELKDKYTIEDCLGVANRYLAKFENDTTYMQTQKYFIFKQTSIVNHEGKITYIYKSTFADMLEGKSDESQLQNEWNELLKESAEESFNDSIII